SQSGQDQHGHAGHRQRESCRRRALQDDGGCRLGCGALSWQLLPGSAWRTGSDIVSACLACHGENGQSQNPGIPSLGAQQAFYVTVQLLMFREHMRVADPMNDMTKGLSDDDLQQFATIINKLPAPRPPDGPVDAARIERARALV